METIRVQSGEDYHHYFTKATKALKHDHRIIERVLTVLEGLTAESQVGSLATWRKVIDFIRNFADRCHHLKEEKIFFPALEEKGIPRVGGPVGIMLMEHEEARGYVRGMADAVTGCEKGLEPARAALVDNARGYVRLLREHIQKEDEILFQMADDVLTQEDQNHLLRQFEEHEAREIGTGVHEKYVKLAKELESSGDVSA